MDIAVLAAERRSLGCKKHGGTVRAQNRFIDLAVVTVVVVLCVVLIDRPVAHWISGRFHGTSVFAIGAFILRPLDTVLIAGALLLVVAVVWKQFDGAPEWLNRFIISGTAAAAALAGALFLKVAIGRSQVYPMFLRDHVYGFRPFAGSVEFMAFPSATMTGVSAFVAGVGVQRRLERAAAAVIVITLAAALLITESHWLSDIIGGTYFGVASGLAVARWFGRRDGLQPDRRVQPTARVPSGESSKERARRG